MKRTRTPLVRALAPPEIALGEVRLTRRDVLALGGGAAAAAAALALMGRAAAASPKDAREKIAELTHGKTVERGRVKLTLPDVTDRGPFTRLVVSVDSPMTEKDHVTAIHVVAERNTVPDVASFHLGPRNGRATVATRIRLKKTQNVVAEMSDGTAFMGYARAKVLTGAGGCG